MSLPRALRRPVLAAAAAAAFLLGAAVGPQVATATTEPDPTPTCACCCACPTSPPTPTPTPTSTTPPPAPVDLTPPGSILGSAELRTDIQVTGTTTAPQVLMTTAPITFDGGPVVVEFVAEYVNHIPAASTNLNSIGFDLMIDGVRMERMTMYGNHGTLNHFGPMVLRDVLDKAPRLLSAGQHTIGIAVWRWSPVQDGYLKYSPGYRSGWGMPIRLTVYSAG